MWYMSVTERHMRQRSHRATTKKNDRYLFGFYGSGERTKGGPVKTLQYGVYEVKYWIASTLESLKMLVTGQVGINEMSGPIGIVKGVSDTYEAGAAVGWFSVFCRNAQLDDLIICEPWCHEPSATPGTRRWKTCILIIEAIRGKGVDPEKEGMVHFIGICLLMALMVVIMFNDIRKLF